MSKPTVTEMITCLKDLNNSNPNKYTLIERLALDRVDIQAAESSHWVQILDKEEENLDTIFYLDIFKHISSVALDLSDSYLLRPINGLVINRSRKRNAWRLDKAEKLLASLIRSR